MQAKAVRMLQDKDRYCIACYYEISPNTGKSGRDDLRYFDNGGLYHPICYDEVENLIEGFNTNNTDPADAIAMFKHLGINTTLLGITQTVV